MMLHCIVENKIAVSGKSLEFKVEAVVRKRQKVLVSWSRICLQCGRPGLDTWVGSLGWEDPLEKGKVPYSSILAWRIHV